MLNTIEKQQCTMSTAVPAIEHDEIAVLRILALDGGLYEQAKISCSGLADKLDVSTQTASRRVQRLDDAGMIDREHVPDGQLIHITQNGCAVLRREFDLYQRIFGDGQPVRLRGSVTTGMGEGRHYIPLEGYRIQFVERLGYEPFPGTLNVTLDEESIRHRSQIESLESIPIDGWEGEDRTYGPADCYPVQIKSGSRETGSPAHAIIPERTHHDEDKLELIAPENLRDSLDLQDGEMLEVEIHGGAD